MVLLNVEDTGRWPRRLFEVTPSLNPVGAGRHCDHSALECVDVRPDEVQVGWTRLDRHGSSSVHPRALAGDRALRDGHVGRGRSFAGSPAGMVELRPCQMLRQHACPVVRGLLGQMGCGPRVSAPLVRMWEHPGRRFNFSRGAFFLSRLQRLSRRCPWWIAPGDQRVLAGAGRPVALYKVCAQPHDVVPAHWRLPWAGSHPHSPCHCRCAGHGHPPLGTSACHRGAGGRPMRGC